MAVQEVRDAWIYLDKSTASGAGPLPSAQGVYQPIHWVAMHRMQCMLRLMPHEGRIADIGCSYGILTLNMAAKKPRATLVGIDPDAQRLAVANQLLTEHPLANCSFHDGTVDDPKIPPRSCSGVVCTETLDHIKDIKPRLQQSIDKLMDLLLPGGRLLLSIPSLEEMGRETAPLPPSPLSMRDFSFLKSMHVDRNCPRWWHLFYVDKI